MVCMLFGLAQSKALNPPIVVRLRRGPNKDWSNTLALGHGLRIALKYLKFDPICRKSGRLIKVENGTGVCSPSRLRLGEVSIVLK